jgi:inhibitor of cysteine peptidase
VSEVVVTKAAAGDTIRIATGGTVVVRLPENPSTGYRWQFEAAVGLTVSGESFSPDSSAPGAAGERVLRLVGSTPGSFVFTAALRRPWETGIPPQDMFSITVEVD